MTAAEASPIQDQGRQAKESSSPANTHAIANTAAVFKAFAKQLRRYETDRASYYGSTATAPPPPAFVPDAEPAPVTVDEARAADAAVRHRVLDAEVGAILAHIRKADAKASAGPETFEKKGARDDADATAMSGDGTETPSAQRRRPLKDVKQQQGQVPENTRRPLPGRQEGIVAGDAEDATTAAKPSRQRQRPKASRGGSGSPGATATISTTTDSDEGMSTVAACGRDTAVHCRSTNPYAALLCLATSSARITAACRSRVTAIVHCTSGLRVATMCPAMASTAGQHRSVAGCLAEFAATGGSAAGITAAYTKTCLSSPYFHFVTSTTKAAASEMRLELAAE